MSKIRVLAIDDSVVIRKLLSEHLGADPDVEVVGTAADGRIGLAKIAELNPDLVILDVEMPVLNGLQTLAALRRTNPKLPVIMFSTITGRGAAATLDALTLGANDYATKSSDALSAGQHIATELLPKIKALCHRERIVVPTEPRPQLHDEKNKPAWSYVPSPVDIVTIGVSTGGPNALAVLVAGLAMSFPVPIVIVQHMPKVFTRLLADRLSAISAFTVREGIEGQELQPGQIWLAPGGFHMEVERTGDTVGLRIHEGPLENSCRPAVDVLFRSVAQAYGARTLGVIMTGMGQDGLRGCEAIREKGGRVIIQDEPSSVVWGMPGAVSRAGLAEKTLPLDDLALEINRIAQLGPQRMASVIPRFRSTLPSLSPTV